MDNKRPDDQKPLKDRKWKSRVDLIQPDFILEIWQILRFWAEKYTENSRQWIPTKDHFSACMRHLLSFQKWDIIDDESWYDHLTHAACNIMFMHYNNKTLINNNKTND